MTLLVAQESPPAANETPAVPPLNMLESTKQSLTELLVSIQNFIPGFIGGLTIFIVGLIVALIVRRILATLLDKIGLEKVSERTGMQEMLHGIGLKTPLPKLVAKVIYFVLILMFLMSATQVVPGLDSIAQVLKDIVTYFPRAASAILYVLVGLLVARLIHGSLLTSAESVCLEYARTLANVVYGFLVVVILTLAFGQMDIETELLSKTIQILLGSIALALALAIGLGMTGVAENIASGVYPRDFFPVGTEVKVADDALRRVTAVGATSTRLEDPHGNFMIVPNTDMIGKTIQGRRPKKNAARRTVIVKKKA